MNVKNYHAILGVAPNATAAEIRKAYRKLAAKHHPDRNRGDGKAEERFKEISEAYDALANPQHGSGDQQGVRRPAPPARGAPTFAPRRRRRQGPTFETGPIELGKVYPVRPGPKLGNVPLNVVSVACSRVPVAGRRP